MRTNLCILIFVASTAPHAWSSAASLQPDAAEQQMLGALRSSKYVRAREQAQAILRSQPHSVFALFTMGRVYQRAETNLPRALHYMRRAERALVVRGAAPKGTYRHWHRRVLLAQVEILGWMDRRRAQLVVIDRHDRLYRPKMELLRVWPLMKLHRFDEALSIARNARLSADLPKRISGYNNLLSIEFERERPVAAYRIGREALLATDERSCVINHNVAEAAFAVFEFTEAERLALKSIQAPIKDCPSTAHWLLANLYLLRADFSRAVAAVKEAREQPIASTYREQFEMFVTAWLTRLLYALGQFEQSLELARRVLRAPNREGLTSYSSEMQEAVYTVDYHAVLRARIEQLAERGSARSSWQRFELWIQRARLELEAWRTRRRATKLLARGKTLLSLLRPYVKPFPAWNAASLAEIAGTAVVRHAIDQMRSDLEPGRATEAYWQALETSLAHRAGDHVRVLQLARSCLAALPQDEALLRARVSVWAGAAAYEQGDRSAARKYFDEALHRWPTAFRVERVALPVKVVSDDDPMAQLVASKILGSPRLRRDRLDTGFGVLVSRRADALKLCLTGARGRRYGCVTSKVSKGSDDDSSVSAAIDRFHDTVFAPLIDLTQQDISSLDGSAVRGRADEVLREVFGQ